MADEQPWHERIRQVRHVHGQIFDEPQGQDVHIVPHPDFRRSQWNGILLEANQVSKAYASITNDMAVFSVAVCVVVVIVSYSHVCSMNLYSHRGCGDAQKDQVHRRGMGEHAPQRQEVHRNEAVPGGQQVHPRLSMLFAQLLTVRRS